MPDQTASEKFRRLLKKYNEYDRNAYQLIYEALDYAHVKKHGRKRGHVTTQELAAGLRLYAIDQFGCLAKTVLNSMNIKTTRDLGEIVFQLIKSDLLGSTAKDKKRQFNNLYDFNKAFNLKPELTYSYETKEWHVKYKQVNNSNKK